MERVADVTSLLTSEMPQGFETARGIVHTLRQGGHSAYLVGGGVRDVLLGLTPKDFDIVTSAKPDEIETIFRHTIPVGRKFGVMTVVFRGQPHEVATYRAEGDYRDKRRPGWVKFADLHADLQRRDFTINGLVLDPETREVHDWVGGLSDLADGVVRTIGDPYERFGEDALRMLRAVRFASRFGFRLDGPTRQALCTSASDVREVAGERIWAELDGMLSGQGRTSALSLLRDCGLLAEILPEVGELPSIGGFSPWGRTLRRVRNLANDTSPDVVWASILADAVAPRSPLPGSWDDDGPNDDQAARASDEILSRLKAPRTLARATARLLARRWYWRHAGRLRLGCVGRVLRSDPSESLPAFWRADADAFGRPGTLAPIDQARLRLRLFKQEAGNGAPVDGRRLISSGQPAGPEIGNILARAERLWLEGALPTDPSVKRWISTRLVNV